MTINCKELTREQCISHLDYLKKVDKETSFDDLITNTSFFKIIYKIVKKSYCTISGNLNMTNNLNRGYMTMT